jgi:hypothetical protein
MRWAATSRAVALDTKLQNELGQVIQTKSVSHMTCGSFGFFHALPEASPEPNTTLRIGLEKTYRWIYDQYMARERGEAGVVCESAAAR